MFLDIYRKSALSCNTFWTLPLSKVSFVSSPSEPSQDNSCIYASLSHLSTCCLLFFHHLQYLTSLIRYFIYTLYIFLKIWDDFSLLYLEYSISSFSNADQQNIYFLSYFESKTKDYIKLSLTIWLLIFFCSPITLQRNLIPSSSLQYDKKIYK